MTATAPRSLQVDDASASALLDDAADIANVLAGGQLGHHASPLAVNSYLGRDDIGTHGPGPGRIAGFFNDRGRCFVTRGFDAEDTHRSHAGRIHLERTGQRLDERRPENAALGDDARR